MYDRTTAFSKVRAASVAFCAAGAVVATGCSGAGVRGLSSDSVPAVVAPAQAGSAAPWGTAAAALTVKPSQLSLYGTGQPSQQAVLVTENGYKGKFTAANTCKKVATVAPVSGKGPSWRANVTAIANGTCTITFADGKGHSVKLPVTDRKGGSIVSVLFVPVKIGLRKRDHPGPKYISPSTQAMVVDVSGPTNTSIISGLTSLSPGCSLEVQGLQCTFGTSLASCPSKAACYTATVTTYDAYVASTNTIPADAAALSISKTTFNIADNQTTDVTFPFSGIPARITAIPASALSAQTGNVVDLVGPGAHPMFAEAFDADNNPISGQGGPTYAISSGGLLALSFTQPPPGSPRFSVTPPSTLQGPGTIATLTVTATYPSGETNGCSVSGAVCQGAVTVDMQSLLAVSTGYSVELFAAEKGIGPLIALASGISNPIRHVAYDANGNLFVATSSPPGTGQAVLEYALGSSIPFRTITTGITNPLKVATDPAGNLFVLNGGSPATVTQYPPGATSPSRTLAIASYPSQFVVDATDDIWISNEAVPSVTYYPHGSTTGARLTGLVRPVGLALDPANDSIYVSDQTNYSVGNQQGCGAGSSPSYCTIYRYAFGSASPTTYSSQSYGGDLVWEPGYGLYADNSTGAELAYYNAGASVPVAPIAWTGGLNAGEGQGIAVDQLGNIFIAAPTNGTVYGYHYSALLYGNASAYVQMTNGLTYPYNLAIVP